MIRINLDIKNASQGQLRSLEAELRILSRQWRSYGPIIKIDGKDSGTNKSLKVQDSSRKRIANKWSRNLSRWQKRQASSTMDQATSAKPQAAQPVVELWQNCGTT